MILGMINGTPIGGQLVTVLLYFGAFQLPSTVDAQYRLWLPVAAAR